MSRIRTVLARVVWDGRGRPTVEAEVLTNNGVVGSAVAPGMGGSESAVAQCAETVRRRIAGALSEVDPVDQATVDRRLTDLANAPGGGAIGRELIAAVSRATLSAGAAERGLQVYEHVADLCGGADPNGWRLPLPVVDLLAESAAAEDGEASYSAPSSAPHSAPSSAPSAGRRPSESLEPPERAVHSWGVVALSANSVRIAVRQASALRRELSEILTDRYGRPDEEPRTGALVQPEDWNDERVGELLSAAARGAGFRPGETLAWVADLAADRRFSHGRYSVGRRLLMPQDWADRLVKLADRQPIRMMLGPLAEPDPEHSDAVAKLGERLGEGIHLAMVPNHQTRRRHRGEELPQLPLVSDAAERNLGDAAGTRPGRNRVVWLHADRISSVTDFLTAVFAARSGGGPVLLETGPGETEDILLVHLALGTSVEFLRLGGMFGSQRLAKYNELVRLEDRLAGQARLVTWAQLCPPRPSPVRQPPARLTSPEPQIVLRRSAIRVLSAVLQIAATQDLELPRRCFALWMLRDIFGRGGAPLELADLVLKLSRRPDEPEFQQTARATWEYLRPGQPVR